VQVLCIQSTQRTYSKNVKKATTKPFGVNVPMLYPNIEEIMKIVDEGVKIVFTSAGNPKIWTSYLKEPDNRLW
jgi:enoyl-[acyl-carrier protein] reductase II